LTLFVYFRQREKEGKHSDIHKFGIRGSLQRQAGEDRVLELCDDCLQVGNSQEDSQEDCKERLEALRVVE
jgi:hypothetical protein